MADSNVPKPRSCYKCGFFAETAETACPNCRRPLHTTTETRVRGGMMAACGVVILGLIGYITLWVVTAMNNSAGNGARFNGNEQEKLAILGLFAMLLTFGAVAVMIGGWQLFTGRRNRIVSWAAVAFAVLIFLVGGGIALKLR